MKNGKYDKRYTPEQCRKIYTLVEIDGRRPAIVAGIYHTDRQRIENVVRRYRKKLAEPLKK